MFSHGEVYVFHMLTGMVEYKRKTAAFEGGGFSLCVGVLTCILFIKSSI